jgi:polyphosphate glucokinase
VTSSEIHQEPTSTSEEHPQPFTLCFDIGGTGLKAAVLDATGVMVTDRVRVPTPYPLAPEQLVENLKGLAGSLPRAARASAGFPGMVRNGVVLTAPSFSTVQGTGSPIDPELVTRWHSFDLAGALEATLGLPVKVANDADLQGAASVSGKGLEVTVTLGTGFGTALLYDGQLLPHLEIAHLKFRKDEDFDHQIGEAARKQIGDKRWLRRVFKAIDVMRNLTAFDHLYVGGGNSARLPLDQLPDDVSVVPNSAGILGGIALWENGHIGLSRSGG